MKNDAPTRVEVLPRDETAIYDPRDVAWGDYHALDGISSRAAGP